MCPRNSLRLPFCLPLPPVCFCLLFCIPWIFCLPCVPGNEFCLTFCLTLANNCTQRNRNIYHTTCWQKSTKSLGMAMAQMQAHLRDATLKHLVCKLFVSFSSQVNTCMQPSVQCKGMVAVLGTAKVRTCGGYADRDRATAAIFAPEGIDTVAL